MSRSGRASLKFIMDVDDEEPDPRMNKRDQASPPGPSRGGRGSSAPYYDNPRDQDNNPYTATTSTRRNPSHHLDHNLPSRTSPSSSSAALTSRAPVISEPSHPDAEDMMNRSYGGQISGSGGGVGGGSNPPNRPGGSPSDAPVKLTPITGRVSRAKKGVPVHVCDICRPSKVSLKPRHHDFGHGTNDRQTFTRAEHLRRHQLSHQTPQFPCHYPDCNRAFHRADLLQRHQARHEQEGDGASSSRRPSTASSNDGGPPRGFYHPQPSSMYSQPSLSDRDADRRGSHTSNNSGYSQGQGNSYVLSSSMDEPMNLNTPSTSGPSYDMSYQPRTQYPLFVVTQGLQQNLTSMESHDRNPGLLAPQDHSPWPSSDSNFSTPSDRSHRHGNAGYSSPTSDWNGHYMAYTPVTTEMSSPLDISSNALPFFTDPFSTSPHAYAQPMDMSMSYNDEALLEQAHQHHAYTAVRSPTPPNLSSSVHSAESLVTLTPALSEPLAMVGRYKQPAALMGTLSSATFLTAVTLSRPIRNAISKYLNVYWERFDVLFPLVHRRSFEIAPDDILRCAMAAVATQYLDGKDDRMKGIQLHEFAWQEVQRVPQWSVQTMQAIVLCEYYARFRGRKAVIQASKPFQSLYSRVTDPQISPASSPFGTTSAPARTLAERWSEWIEAESRRRILINCFCLDIHTSVYHQQRPTHRFRKPRPPIPLITASQDLWAARSPEEWERLIASGLPTTPPALSELRQVTVDMVTHAPLLDATTFLMSEILQLSERDHSTFDFSLPLNENDMTVMDEISTKFPGSPIAYTYLALHCTPLHDLLAVSGDTWLFTRKVTQPQKFQQHQKRLTQWIAGPHAAVAVQYAAKALDGFLGNTNVYNNNINRHETAPLEAVLDPAFTSKSDAPARCTEPASKTWNQSNLSDYWALYVCALICWAFGQPRGRHASSTAANTQLSHPSSTTADGTEAGSTQDLSEAEALDWLRVLAALPTDEVPGARGQRREALAVVAMVRRRLEVEAIGGRSRLLVDALGVLRKLAEGTNWKWF